MPEVGESHWAKPIGCVVGLSLSLRDSAWESGRASGGESVFESQEFTDLTSGTGSFQKAVGKVM